MARRGSQVPVIARVAAPVGLGLLFAAFVAEALFVPFSPGIAGVFAGLTVTSLLLSVAFAGLLIASHISQTGEQRIWSILLGATIGIWAIGSLLHYTLPRVV